MKSHALFLALTFSSACFANNHDCRKAYTKVMSVNDITTEEATILKDTQAAIKVCAARYSFVGEKNTANLLNSGARFCLNRNQTNLAKAACQLKVLEIVGEQDQLFIPKELR